MPVYAHIDRYHRELAELIKFGGADNEETSARRSKLSGGLLC